MTDLLFSKRNIEQELGSVLWLLTGFCDVGVALKNQSFVDGWGLSRLTDRSLAYATKEL